MREERRYLVGLSADNAVQRAEAKLACGGGEDFKGRRSREGASRLRANQDGRVDLKQSESRESRLGESTRQTEEFGYPMDNGRCMRAHTVENYTEE